jgi:hypothetical protein
LFMNLILKTIDGWSIWVSEGQEEAEEEDEE